MTNGDPVHHDPAEVRIVDHSAAVERQEIVEFHLRLLRRTPVPFVTYALVGANVLVYVLNVVTGLDPMSPDAGQLVEWGAEYGPRTLRGEWWRMLTSAFLHGGLFHVAINMWVLWSLGRFGERLFGHLGYLVLYLFSALMGAVASLWWNPSGIGVGASGAIFGLIGGLLGVSMARNATVPPKMLLAFRSSAMSFLGYNLVFGLMFPFIDNAAHIGGFLGGIVSGVLLSRPVRDEGPHNWTLRAVVVLVASVGIVGGLAYFVLPEPPSDYIAAEAVFMEVQEKAIARAVEYEDQWSDGLVTGPEFAAGLRKDVIPEWEKATRALEQLDGLSPDLAERFGLMERFARARWKFFLAYAASADGSDPTARERMGQFNADAQAALDAMDRLNEPSGMFGIPGGREE